MFVGNLSPDTTEEQVREMFSEYGTVRSIHIVTDVFTRKCRGFGFVEMEGHEARAAIKGLKGRMMYNNRPLNVAFEEDRSSRGRRHR